MHRLYLVRHGENRANLTKELSHREVDYSLTEKGILQARQTAEVFRTLPLEAIYSSPLKRARETAEIIGAARGLPVTVLEDLREVNVGDLEGQPVTAELWAQHNRIIEGWMDGKREVSFPGGEDYWTLRDRMLRAVAQILEAHPEGASLAIGHGGIFSFTLADVCPDASWELIRATPNHNCSITEILVNRREGRIHGQLVSLALYAHLHGAAAELVPGTPEAHTFQAERNGKGAL